MSSHSSSRIPCCGYALLPASGSDVSQERKNIMAKAKAPSPVKKGLENACQKAAKKVSKAAPGEKNQKKVADLLTKHVCKEVDQKILKLIAEELAKLGKGASAKAPPNTIPKVSVKPELKDPGSGVPSFTIPLPEFDVGSDAKGKFELKVWGDPKEFQKADKGVFVKFKVSF